MKLAEIESKLVYYLRPHFLSINKEKDFIHIVISHPKFNNLSIQQRVSLILSLIVDSNDDTLKEAIIIEAYTSEEMDDLFENWL
jgi:hypothetical protein